MFPWQLCLRPVSRDIRESRRICLVENQIKRHCPLQCSVPAASSAILYYMATVKLEAELPFRGREINQYDLYY